MARIFLLFLFSLSVMTKASQAEVDVEKACFHVEGMTCAACSLTLKISVQKLKGIESVETSVEERFAKVVYDPRLTTLEEIKSKIDSVGYKATVKTQCGGA